MATDGYVEQAYRIIRQRILDNVYPAGYRALEREFAEELSLSRTPVREALRRGRNSAADGRRRVTISAAIDSSAVSTS